MTPLRVEEKIVEITVENVIFKNGMKKGDIPKSFSDNSDIMELDDTYILEFNQPVNIRDVKFCVEITFYNNNLGNISLVALPDQMSEKYRIINDRKQLHETWLLNNYGKPTRIGPYGYIYDCEGGRIVSEFDPRSGSNNIFFVFSKSMIS